MKHIFVACVLMFLIGCAHQESHRIGGFSNDLTSGTIFYGQYEMLYKGDNNSIHSKLFTPNGRYLSKDITKIHFGLYIKNPNPEVKFSVWIEARFVELDTGNLYKITEYVYGTQKLPDEFISIPLPIKTRPNSNIKFWVNVKSKDGVVLYESSKVNYKIGK